MKISPVPVIVVALISLSLPACHDTHAADEHEHVEHHKIVLTSPEAKDVTITQRYVCQIHSQRNTDICALQSGYLEAMNIKEGQAVKQGDVMFQVMPVLYQARLDAELAEVQVAQIEYSTTKKLAEGDRPVVSERDLALHQAKLAKAQANLAKARAELAFATVRAPFDGIIDRQLKQQGALVKEGEILTNLSDNSVMWVHFNVPEANYLKDMATLALEEKRDQQPDPLAELNRTSKIELLLASGRKFPHLGKFGSLGGKFNNETGNTDYRADFPNPERLLRHGQTGTLLIHRTLPNAIVIPQRAVFEVLDKQYVYVIGADNVAHQHLITIQDELDDIFIIKSGISVHDKIVLEGVRQVHDGEKIGDSEFRKPEEALSNLKNHAE
ncbi:MAG: efflux RND transporter periplasmic adaptor subunit [Planctomycetes bacterium]|nr:efflux RND transporter periplasmic adaptor subunit [Planctomycetota bacterium]